jgi:uncharacterized membrane protein YedE/YeeE
VLAEVGRPAIFAAMTTSLIGGALIGLAAGGLWLYAGRVAGVSGILAGACDPRVPDRAWRWLFVAGLVLGGLLGNAVVPGAVPDAYAGSGAILALAGGLVGVGARLANGCTSGHGVCGVARFSPRSLAAVAVFMAAGIATVAVRRWLGAAS